MTAGDRSLIDTLSAAVAKHGREWCGDPRRCEALLEDLLPGQPRDVSILAAAVEAGAAREFRGSQSALPLAVRIERLVTRLHDDQGFPDDVARRAVCIWAVVLGACRADEIPAPRSEKHATPLTTATGPATTAEAVRMGFASAGQPASGGDPPVTPFRRLPPALLLGGVGLLAAVIAGAALWRVDGRPRVQADHAGRTAKPSEPTVFFPPKAPRPPSPQLVGPDQTDFAIFDEARTWVAAQGRTVAVARNPASLLDPQADTAWLASQGLTDGFAAAHRLFPEGFPLCVAAFPASFGLADRLDVIAASRLTARLVRLSTCSEIAALGHEARRTAAGRSLPENVIVLVVAPHFVSGTRAELDDGLVFVTASAGIDRWTIAADELTRDLAQVAAMVMGGDAKTAIGEVIVTCPQALERTVAGAVAGAALPARASVVPDLVSDGLAALGAVLTGTSDKFLLLMQAPPTSLGVLVAGAGADEFIAAVTPGTTIPTDRKIVVRLPAAADGIVIAEQNGVIVRPLHTLKLEAGDPRGFGRAVEVLFDIDANMGLRVEATEAGGGTATWSSQNR